MQYVSSPHDTTASGILLIVDEGKVKPISYTPGMY